MNSNDRLSLRVAKIATVLAALVVGPLAYAAFRPCEPVQTAHQTALEAPTPTFDHSDVIVYQDIPTLDLTPKKPVTIRAQVRAITDSLRTAPCHVEARVGGSITTCQ